MHVGFFMYVYVYMFTRAFFFMCMYMSTRASCTVVCACFSQATYTRKMRAMPIKYHGLLI